MRSCPVQNTCRQRRDTSASNHRHTSQGHACESNERASSRTHCSEAHKVLQRGAPLPFDVSSSQTREEPRASTSPSRHIGTFCSRFLCLCSRLCFLLVFPCVEHLSVGFLRGVALALQHHTALALRPRPLVATEHWCTPASLLLVVAAHVYSSLPSSALAKCWLRGLYTHPTHTCTQDTRPCPARLHKAPRWCIPPRHVV